MGRDLALTLSAFRFVTESDNADFDTENTGFLTALAFPIGEFSNLSVRYSYRIQELSEVNQNSSPILQRELGERTSSAIGYNFTYDTRNRGLDPNAGVLLSFGQEFAGIGGNVEYISTRVRAIALRRLRNEDYALRARFEAGNITGLSDYTTGVVDRFFLNSTQIRGL